MSKIEFGKKGIEGVKKEGAFENDGWSSIKDMPFAGNSIQDDMIKQANEINEMIADLPTVDDEGSETIEPSTTQEIENSQDEAQKQIEKLKENLHKLFNN